jgi:putative ABC transport system permease protein
VSEHGVEVENVWLTGASADLFRIRDMDIERGRSFTAPEDRAGMPVVILGFEAAETLFGTLDPLGRSVKINNMPFRVIGVMKKQGSLFGQSMDNRAFAPARSPMGRLVNPQGIVDRVLVKPLNPADHGSGACRHGIVMRMRHKLRPTEDNDFAIETASESMNFWENIRRILMIAFPGCSSRRRSWSAAS